MRIEFLKSKPRLALLGASGLIAGAAFAGTTAISHAANSTAPAAKAATAPEPAETPEATGTEAPAAAEKPEAGVVGTGHSDEVAGATGAAAAAESNVDHQASGAE